jgi:hypothetical protein
MDSYFGPGLLQHELQHGDVVPMTVCQQHKFDFLRINAQSPQVVHKSARPKGCAAIDEHGPLAAQQEAIVNTDRDAME